ncbi:MAG: penicillin acylase family protein [candidate division WOR-3 bacterium]|jgi:penicillin amidase
MYKRHLWAVILLLLSVLFFYLLNSRHGMVPPLGKFMNPFAGFWTNNTARDAVPRFAGMKSLRDSVVVVWDDRRVPHIFAQNAYDLCFTQGYVTARDRLWQMEFQVAVIAGQLAEIVGDEFLEYDVFFRRCGIIHAAENALREILADPETRIILEAYTDGVNAYISEIGDRDLPLEYKIFDYRPKPWTFLKSALTAEFMAWNLTAFDIPELLLTRSRMVFGEDAVDEMYPIMPPYNDPVIPIRTRWRFRPQPIPPKPDPDFVPVLDVPGYSDVLEGKPGSNNWAVAPRKTINGHAILCNDLHLPLYMPSMWYEIQLVMPGMNVYGASLPGAPLVTLGFNEYVAWGVTNAMADVIDWYDIEFRDETRSFYLHEGQWLPTRKRIEEIKVRGRKTVIDTVVYTHHGPVVCARDKKPYDARIPKGAAMRWVGHDASNELTVFLKLNQAHNYDEGREAIASHDCPALNFVFADKTGDIAIWHAGKLPIRWPGQGRYVNDGRSKQHEWHGWIPREHLPHVHNPDRGYVSSANQYPVDEKYPYYLSGSHWCFDRANRINERLSEMENITADSLIDLQNDVMDIVARKILPFLLASMDKDKLFLQERRSYEELEAWDYRFDVDLIAPTIFTYWWEEISDMVWKDEMEEFGDGFVPPRYDATVSLILERPQSPFFKTDSKQGRGALKEIISKAFHRASSRLFEDLGSFGDDWKWGRVRKTDIVHLAQIPGLGRRNLSKPGNAHTINVNYSIPFGRAWRMIVSLGPVTKGWGVYPGGQSGNPGSRFYDCFVQDYLDDNVYEFLFLDKMEAEHKSIVGRTVLRRLR